MTAKDVQLSGPERPSDAAPGSGPEMLSLSDPGFWAQDDWADAFATLRRERPVSFQSEPPTAWNPTGGRGYWAVTRFDDVRAISRDTTRFVSGLGTEIPDQEQEIVRIFGGMLNMDDPEHRRLRALVSKPFTPASIERFADHARREARRLLGSIAPRGECDLMSEVFGVYPAEIICHMMGVPEAYRPEMVRLTGVALGPTYGMGDSYEAVLELVELTAELARHRRDHPQDDLLTQLTHAVVDGDRLTDEEVGVFATLLCTAGIETTGTALAQGMIAMDRFPRERERWQADFDRLAPSAVEEIVRWASPVMQFRRTAIEDVQVAGETIFAGDKVVLWYWSANRDETAFERPDELDLARRPNRHAAFGGGGPHFCLGAHLARMEMTIMYDELFGLLPDVELAAAPQLMRSSFVNGVRSLPVRYTAHVVA